MTKLGAVAHILDLFTLIEIEVHVRSAKLSYFRFILVKWKQKYLACALSVVLDKLCSLIYLRSANQTVEDKA